HVRSFTVRNPDVPPPLRGTYGGLATPAVITHLQRLGVTAVELMPVHAFADDRFLVEKGLRNHWGYNSIGYFTPEARYSSSGNVSEFKTMVKAFHSAGMEVILDVVYNHTAEGNHLGPTLSFRGIDNASYYRLNPENKRHYVDYTGCGNTLNMQNPRVLQLIMDSLRYWITEMHVDGFRFDLASALARELHEVDRLGAFFDIIRQDPVISQVKLIAEPWDLGEGGYQVGNFPPGWTEWNDKYRDTMRSFWRGDGGIIGDFAQRLTGSSDLYERSGRRPHASINYATCHDGFTLHDLVTYNQKHNEANSEANRDGHNDNRAWNFGVEGETDDPAINALRARQKRNLVATLMLSQGVPMMLGGDEIDRTQKGNNNAYCQDNEISWYDWSMTPEKELLLQFFVRMIKFRLEHPIFHRRNFFQGRPIRGSGVKDVIWLTAKGVEMTDAQWRESQARSLAVYFSGEGLAEKDEKGRPVSDATFLVLFNSHEEQVVFRLPDFEPGSRWLMIMDTAYEHGLGRGGVTPAGGTYTAEARSLVLLQEQKARE
ncbi:MAG TPA: glycogen debranching protein GlgX, partial [Burkholderiales bacterium]|nr:glycogen debranching protein GlgX [Burkholderiales bacterium]